MIGKFVALILGYLALASAFSIYGRASSRVTVRTHFNQPIQQHSQGLLTTRNRNSLQMNFFEDAFRFFSNMNKEASAKHILMKGPDASKKLAILKEELANAEDLQAAFSELASKVRSHFRVNMIGYM